MGSSSDKRLTVGDLSPDQRDVYHQIVGWACGRQSMLLTCGGLAGSGKSTLLGVFAAQTELHVAYCAFTCRAASVLKRKLQACGVRVSDSTYHPLMEKQKFAAKWAGVFSSDPDATYCGTIHRLVYRPMINEKEEIIGWNKRETLDRKYDLIVVDEASMVSSEMLADLQAHGVPILAVGDHGQLPPVMSSGSVVQNPMLKLEKIHRQAEGNPIIQLAHHVRSGGSLKNWDGGAGDNRIVFMSKKIAVQVLENAYKEASSLLDVGVLCWTNKNRVSLNGFARKALGRKGIPVKGELVICLKNKPPIFNGMRGLLRDHAELADQEGATPWNLYAQVDFPEEGLLGNRLVMCSAQFNREKPFKDVEEFQSLGIDVQTMKEAGSLYDFGYCLTVHKSQGSGFDHVVLFKDMPDHFEDAERFYYTAITRSSNRLTVLT
jgi:exodeoxyribonuclease-5